jgi:predicted permease
MVTDGFLQDFGLVFRTLRKKPVASALVVMTLAAGIGAATAAFSVLNAIAFRDLPVKNPKALIELSVTMGSSNTVGFSVPMVRALERNHDALLNLIGFAWQARANVEVGDELKQADLLRVTGDFYSVLGTRPAIGRLIGPQDMSLASFSFEPVAVLGWGFWQREYGGDVGAIGKVIRIEGKPFTIIGIAPRGFTALSMIQEPNVTVPLATNEDPQEAAAPGMLWVHLAGHLAPGIRLEQARARLAPLWTSIKTDLVPANYAPQRRANFLSLGLNVWPAQNGMRDGRSRFVQPLWFLLALAVIVLAVACMNAAGLMLARTAQHTHDIGIRMALGASSWDIRRQAVAEAIVLASLGSSLGLLIAQWASPAIAGFMLKEWPGSVVLRLTPDLHELVIVATIVLCICLLFGALPVWRMPRRSSTDLFQGGARVAARIGRVGPILVAGQVALAIVASIDAGLLVRTLQHRATADPGFNRAGVTVAELQPRPGVPFAVASPAANAYDRQLFDSIRAATGVRDVVFSQPPLTGVDWLRSIAAADAPGVPIEIAYAPVSPGFVNFFGLTLQEGRDFTWSDGSGRPRIAIVSQTLADRLYPGRSAVGEYINFGPLPAGQHIEIVGVIKDIKFYDVKNGSPLMLFVPTLQNPEASQPAILLRGALPAAALREAVFSLGRSYVLRVRSLDDIAKAATRQEQLAAIAGSIFSAFAVGLAALGLYGLLMYVVSRRAREFAIRVALGGRAWTLINLVLRQGAGIVATGTVFGSLVAIVSIRWLESLLYGIKASDALSLGIAALVLTAVLVIACAIPAARAARADPLTLMRAE